MCYASYVLCFLCVNPLMCYASYVLCFLCVMLLMSLIVFLSVSYQTSSVASYVAARMSFDCHVLIDLKTQLKMVIMFILALAGQQAHRFWSSGQRHGRSSKTQPCQGQYQKRQTV